MLKLKLNLLEKLHIQSTFNLILVHAVEYFLFFFFKLELIINPTFNTSEINAVDFFKETI